MAFLIDKFNYKAGTLGDIENNLSAKSLNAYAFVTAITNSSITIDLSNAYTRAFETFKVGGEIFFHVSAAAGTDTTHLGKWNSGLITAISSEVIEISFDPTETLPIDDFDKYYCQVLTIPHFKNLTLNSGEAIAPLGYAQESHYGGILAVACSETLTLNGGHIDLADCGIPPDEKALRPLTPQEQTGTLDTDKYSGWENSQTKDRILLNSGDGAAIIIAKKLSIDNSSSRIGNPNFKGIQFCRGASDSRNLPANATNIGGATIFIAAETISDFSPDIIAKYRDKTATTGRGICRCYIASSTILRNDEGLYAYDCLSNSERPTKNLNVRHFGKGTFGIGNNITSQINNYATVTAIEGAKVSYKDKTISGLANIQAGALVMIHVTHKGSNYFGRTGEFFLAEVLEDDGSALLLNALPRKFLTEVSNIMNNYTLQIISIPQYKNFTLSTSHTATPKFNGSQGGIFAIAVSDTCDIRGGKINVEGKGGGNAYGRTGLAYIGNAQDAIKIPIGQGHGSVFILAKNLVMNSSTRIGATYSGAAVATGDLENPVVDTCGYSGNYATGWKNCEGWGGGGGGIEDDSHRGGYGSNATTTINGMGLQGAHIMIIANTITGFNQAAISTGGTGAVYTTADWSKTYVGAGYGATGYRGGGGYNGGGGGNGRCGGSSGWAFIYCNNAIDQNTTDTVYF